MAGCFPPPAPIRPAVEILRGDPHAAGYTSHRCGRKGIGCCPRLWSTGRQTTSTPAAGTRSRCDENRFRFGPWWPGASTIESSRGRNKMQKQGHRTCSLTHPRIRAGDAEGRHLTCIIHTAERVGGMAAASTTRDPDASGFRSACGCVRRSGDAAWLASQVGAKIARGLFLAGLRPAPECACSARGHGCAVLRNAPAAHSARGCTLCGV